MLVLKSYFSLRQWQLARVNAIGRQDIKGVKLELVVVFAAVQPIEIRNADQPKQHSFAIDHERIERLFKAASTIRG